MPLKQQTGALVRIKTMSDNTNSKYKSVKESLPEMLTFPAPYPVVDVLLSTFGKKKDHAKMELLFQHFVNNVPINSFNDANKIGFAHYKERLIDIYSHVRSVADKVITKETYTAEDIDHITALMGSRPHGNAEPVISLVLKALKVDGMSQKDVSILTGVNQSNISRSSIRLKSIENKIVDTVDVLKSVYS
jgi:hypothetical protein